MPGTVLNLYALIFQDTISEDVPRDNPYPINFDLVHNEDFTVISLKMKITPLDAADRQNNNFMPVVNNMVVTACFHPCMYSNVFLDKRGDI